MTDITDRLRAAALAATPGPWTVTGNGRDEWYVYAKVARYSVSWAGDSPVKVAWVPWEPSGKRHKLDSAYIAAASPDVILALLYELDTLLDEAERLRLRIENDAIRLRAAADAGELGGAIKRVPA